MNGRVKMTYLLCTSLVAFFTLSLKQMNETKISGGIRKQVGRLVD